MPFTASTGLVDFVAPDPQFEQSPPARSRPAAAQRPALFPVV